MSRCKCHLIRVHKEEPMYKPVTEMNEEELRAEVIALRSALAKSEMTLKKVRVNVSLLSALDTEMHWLANNKDGGDLGEPTYPQ